MSRGRGRRRGKGTGRLPLSKKPDMGLHLTILMSQPQRKPKVGPLTDQDIQVSHQNTFKGKPARFSVSGHTGSPVSPPLHRTGEARAIPHRLQFFLC